MHDFIYFISFSKLEEKCTFCFSVIAFCIFNLALPFKNIYLLQLFHLSGDPLYDLIPIYLDVFRGDPQLLKQFMESYKLPFMRKPSEYGMLHNGPTESGMKFQRISFHAMYVTT